MAKVHGEEPGNSRRPAKRSRQRVIFHQGKDLELIQKLSRKHPGEWFAIAIEQEDIETGLTKGQVIAHSTIDSVVVNAIREHRAAHPDEEIKFFTTDMVAPWPRIPKEAR